MSFRFCVSYFIIFRHFLDNFISFDFKGSLCRFTRTVNKRSQVSPKSILATSNKKLLPLLKYLHRFLQSTLSCMHIRVLQIKLHIWLSVFCVVSLSTPNVLYCMLCSFFKGIFRFSSTDIFHSKQIIVMIFFLKYHTSYVSFDC